MKVDKFFEAIEVEINEHKQAKLVASQLQDLAITGWEHKKRMQAHRKKESVQKWKMVKRVLKDCFVPHNYGGKRLTLLSRALIKEVKWLILPLRSHVNLCLNM